MSVSLTEEQLNNKFIYLMWLSLVTAEQAVIE